MSSSRIAPYGPLVVLGFGFLIGGVLLVYSIQQAPLLWDEWGMVVRASSLDGAGLISSSGDIATTGNLMRSSFEPWNNHLLAFGILSSALLISLFGLSEAPFIAFTLLGLFLLSGTLYFYARPRLGPWLALLPALVPLFFAGGSEFFGTGIQFSRVMGPNAIYALLFGIGALILVEKRSTIGDIGATGFLIFSLATFSYGLAFLVGVATALILAPNVLHRLYVVGLPFLLYAIWWIWARSTFGAASDTLALSNILVLPAYFFDSLSAVLTSVFGLTIVGAGPATTLQFGAGTQTELQLLALLLLAGLLLAILLLTNSSLPPLKRRSLWPPLITLIALWGSQGLVAELGIRMPGSPRYLFGGAVLLAMVIPELFRGVKVSRPAVMVLLLLTLVALLGNSYRFWESKQLLDRSARETSVVASAVRLASENASIDFVPARDLGGYAPSMWIDSSSFNALESKFGVTTESSITPSELSRVETRKIDETLVKAFGVELFPGATLARDCSRLESSQIRTLAHQEIQLEALKDTRITLGRFAPSPTVIVGDLAKGDRATLAIPRDASPRPWMLVADQALRICYQSAANR